MNVNIISKLKRILDNYTVAYKSDFEYDRQELIQAKPGDSFIWICRKCGTWLYPLNKALVKDTSQYNGIKYYAESDSNNVKTFIVRIEDTTDKGPIGKVYETNINRVWKTIRKLSVFDIQTMSDSYLKATIKIFYKMIW